MKNLKLKGSLIITGLTRVESLWALILLMTNIGDDKMETTIQINSSLYWLFQGISAIAIFAFAYYILGKISNLRFEMELNNLVGRRLNMNTYLNQFSGIEFYRLPNESDEDVFKRLPKGQYFEMIKTEYHDVKNLVVRKYNKKPSEVTPILDKIFFVERKNK